MKKIYALLIAVFLITPVFGQWNNLGSAGFTSGAVQYLQLDVRTGVPYIAYKDGAVAQKATVMKFNGGSWELVGSAGFSDGVARDQSLYVKGDSVFVAYSDDAHSDRCTVMLFDGTSWSPLGVPGFSYQSGYLSLAMDGDDLYFAFSGYVAGGYKTCVLKFNSGTSLWDEVGAPGFSDGDAWYQKLIIEDGNLYVSYKDFANGNKMTVMTFDGTDWIPVGTKGFTAGDADQGSLAVDGTTPYVAYKDVANGNKISVMKYDGSDWVNVGPTGFSTGAIYSASIVLYEGKPVVTYTDLGIDTKTVVKEFNGTDWVEIGMANISEGNAGSQTIAENNGVFYVSYRDDFMSGKASVMQYDLGLGTIANDKSIIEIYPNPVQNILNVQSEFTIKNIQIVDSYGKTVYSDSKSSISVEELASGIYIIQVITDSGTTVKKFIKE